MIVGKSKRMGFLKGVEKSKKWGEKVKKPRVEKLKLIAGWMGNELGCRTHMGICVCVYKRGYVCIIE